MINWQDRRFIGSLFLASSAIDVQTNPRRWIVQGGNVDTSTTDGLAAFQAAILAYAANSVKIMKRADAQGMIVWDIEGEEPGAVYYGAPERIGDIAPEMESLVNGVPLCDAFFQVFHDAGLQTGVCVRPQKLMHRSTNRWWQEAVTPEEEYLEMKSSISYARTRWGCKLFYIDSNAAVLENFRRLASDFQDVLLIPEQSFPTTQFHSYTAPYASFHHFGSTRTNPQIRHNYPGAFRVIFGVNPSFQSNNQPVTTPSLRDQRRKEIVDGMRNGDVYGTNMWFWNPEIEILLELKEEAKQAAVEAPLIFHCEYAVC